MLKWIRNIFKKKETEPYQFAELELKTSPIEVSSLMDQHRKVYAFPTTVGLIKLKHLPKKDHDRITARLASMDPNWANKAQRLAFLADKERLSMKPLSANEMKEFYGLLDWAAEYTDQYVLPCYVEPKMNTSQELEALLDSLHVEEVEKLEKIHLLLTKPQAVQDRDKAMISLCKAFQIPLAIDLAGENMTVAQFSALYDTANQEQQETIKMLEKRRGMV